MSWAPGSHTHTTFVAPWAVKMSCTRRQACTYLAGSLVVSESLLWVPSQLYQLPFISWPQRRNRGALSAFRPFARLVIMASWLPLLMASRPMDGCQVIIGIRPPAMSHCSRPEGIGLDQ